jgi:methanogenic corrinoid protein MtbC1
MIGGAAVTPQFATDIGADAYGNSAAAAVDKALALLPSSRA